MAAKNRKELKENELAGALSENIDKIKPHLPKIILGVVGLISVVFLINYYLSTRNSGKEAKSKNLILFSVEQSAAQSLSTLDKQIEDYPNDNTAAWAHLLKADKQLATGTSTIFEDKASGKESIEQSISNYKSAIEKAGDDSILKERATLGWARALESIGKFDESAQKYESIVSDFPDSPIAKLAETGIARVNNDSNRQFYVMFEARENNAFTKPLTEPAPATNSGLPSRPDFTYPGEEPIKGTDFPIGNPGTGTGSKVGPPEPPTQNDDPKKTDTKNDRNNTDKKSNDAPPKPPVDVLKGDNKKTEAPKKSDPKTDVDNKADVKKTEPTPTTNEKTPKKADEKKESAPAKSENKTVEKKDEPKQ